MKTITVKILDNIDKNKFKIVVGMGKEKNVDFLVRTELGKYYNPDNIKQSGTGVKEIDTNIPSPRGKGTRAGELDILLFDCFGNKNIDMIIENKAPDNPYDNPIEQAIAYANGLNKLNSINCRVVIGYNPADNNDIQLRVLVKDNWEKLIINGDEVNSFIGKDILNIIYNNPDENEFKIVEEVKFTQRDFHNLIEGLRKEYRQITGMHDDTKIDFTIAFISLKMLLEKEIVINPNSGVQHTWDSLINKQEIINAVDTVTKIDGLKEKYLPIFRMTDNKKNGAGKVTFDFLATLNSIEKNETVMRIRNKISEIPHMHSLKIDLFGEVYEVLASKKTKSDFGEYFTRRHIIRPLIRCFLTDNDLRGLIESNKKLCDTSCGTGGFLTEAFKYIEEYYNMNLNTFDNKSIDLSELAQKTICGYDINGSNIARSKINMYLAGDGFSEIETADTLKLKGKNNTFDYILTNVPYGSPEEGYLVDEKVTRNKRLEVNFLIKIVQLLKVGGKALIIIPDGLLEAPSLGHVREWLLKQCKLNAVIGLPKWAFAPYTKEKTYVIFIEKRVKPLETIEDNSLPFEKTWMYIVDNDGYANSDKRFETDLKDENGKWLHNEFSEWVDKQGKTHHSILEERYKIKESPKGEVYYTEWDEKINGKKYGYLSMEKILENKIIEPVKIKKPIEIQNIIETAIKNSLLTLEEVEFVEEIRKSNNGKLKNLAVKDFIEETDEGKVLKEEWEEIFTTIGIIYDTEAKGFYNINEEDITYLLNFTPEKYFRQKETKPISLEELRDKRKKAETKIKNLVGSFPKNDDVLDVEKLLSNEDSEGLFIKEICNVDRGTVISEADIYKNYDKDGVPVYSSKTENDGVMGYVSREFYNKSTNKGEPNTLTWNTDGNAGKVFLREKEYLYTNVCGKLTLKPDKQINLKWLQIVLNNETKKYTTSNANNGKLMSGQMKNIKIKVPDIKIQEKIVEEYKRIEDFQLQLQEALDSINL